MNSYRSPLPHQHSSFIYYWHLSRQTANKASAYKLTPLLGYNFPTVDKAQRHLCCISGSALWNHFDLPSSPIHRVDKAQCPLCCHSGSAFWNHFDPPVITYLKGWQGQASSGSILWKHFDPPSSPMHRVDKAQCPLCCYSGSALWNHFDPTVITHAHHAFDAHHAHHMQAQCPLCCDPGFTLDTVPTREHYGTLWNTREH